METMAPYDRTNTTKGSMVQFWYCVKQASTVCSLTLTKRTWMCRYRAKILSLEISLDENINFLSIIFGISFFDSSFRFNRNELGCWSFRLMFFQITYGLIDVPELVILMVSFGVYIRLCQFFIFFVPLTMKRRQKWISPLFLFTSNGAKNFLCFPFSSSQESRPRPVLGSLKSNPENQ